MTHNKVYMATPTDAEVKRLTEILDVKYENLRKVAEKASHLSKSEQEDLFNLLSNYKDLVDGTLG